MTVQFPAHPAGPVETNRHADEVEAAMPAHELRWRYGPTADDPEPGKMWHYDCGGEVYVWKDGIHSCARCGAQDEEGA